MAFSPEMEGALDAGLLRPDHLTVGRSPLGTADRKLVGIGNHPHSGRAVSPDAKVLARASQGQDGRTLLGRFHRTGKLRSNDEGTREGRPIGAYDRA